jgi:hypothetical protein
MNHASPLSLLTGLALALLASACAKAPVDAAAAAAPATTTAAPVAATAPTPESAAVTDDPAPAASSATSEATGMGEAVASTVANVAGTLQGNIGEGVAKAVSLSTNRQAHEYAGLLAAVTGEMLQSNPDACARLLLPAQFGPISWDAFPASQRDRFMALQQAIFATAQASPTPAPGEDEAGPLYDAMAEKAYATYGDQAFAGMQGDAGAATLCRAWNRVYAGLAAESVDDGGRAMRWLNAP